MMYKTVITMGRKFDRENNWINVLADQHDQKVDRLLSYGWKPLGGVSYSESNGYAVLVQAMVKGD